MTKKPTLNSMTGFARSEGGIEGCTWVWEAKSVNAKGLDVRCRIPAGFETLEPKIRELAQARFTRGNLSINLQLNWDRPAAVYQVNADALEHLRELLPALREMFPDCQPASLDGLLSLKGVLEPGDDSMDGDLRERIDAAALTDFEQLIARLLEARADEGRHLHGVLTEQLDTIVGLCKKAETIAAAQPDAIKARLAEQVRELLDAVPALPEERLAQEAAVLMLKADVREELDRLRGHCDAAATLLSRNDAVGRRLDFLCQEFNREANTVCSKSADIELTRVGLDLKAVIEQMREQVQNVE